MFPQELPDSPLIPPRAEDRPVGTHGLPAGLEAHAESGPPQVGGERLYVVRVDGPRRRFAQDTHLEHRTRYGRNVGHSAHHVVQDPDE
jgi:hypothetical protein